MLLRLTGRRFGYRHGMYVWRGLLGVTIVAWVVVLLVLAQQVWFLMWEQWAAQVDGGSSQQLTMRAAQSMLNVSIALFAGPALIAAVAMLSRLKWTAVAFATVAALIAIPAGAVARDSYRTLHPVEPYQPPRNPYCVPISGGRQCPGG